MLVPVHPTTAARYLETFAPSGAKSDPSDTDSLICCCVIANGWLLPGRFVVDAEYVGNKAIRLPISQSISNTDRRYLIQWKFSTKTKSAPTLSICVYSRNLPSP
jgi:hypothetical protein